MAKIWNYAGLMPRIFDYIFCASYRKKPFICAWKKNAARKIPRPFPNLKFTLANVKVTFAELSEFPFFKNESKRIFCRTQGDFPVFKQGEHTDGGKGGARKESNFRVKIPNICKTVMEPFLPRTS